MHCRLGQVAGMRGLGLGLESGGHDRTIISIKPEHVEALLNPDPANLQALYDILDDKRHPFCEQKIAV